MDHPVKTKQLLSSFDMPCQVCREPSKSRCPSCRTPYCCKACQRADWKRGHKTECKVLTDEFQRRYSYDEPSAKKEAPPVVVIPDSVRPTIDLKHTTKEQSKPADEATYHRGSCPICLELRHDLQLSYFACCGNTICYECFKKCDAMNQICPLCRAPTPTTDAYIARLKRRVDKGDAIAQYILGVAYEEGVGGLSICMKRAAQLDELPAAPLIAPLERRYAALGNLSMRINGTTGVKMHKKKALHYFKLAVNQGNADAQCSCGSMYYNGEGVERDFVEAQRLWELAAAQGHWGAQSNLDIGYWCAAVHSGRRVFVFGVFTTQVLDLDDMVFTEGPPMLSVRIGCAAIAIDAHRVLVVGGNACVLKWDVAGVSFNTTEILDLEKLTFTAGPNMHLGRAYCAVVALDARRILVVGGGDVDDDSMETTEVLDLGTMVFTQGPNLLSLRTGCAVVRLDAHRCLVVGGRDGRDGRDYGGDNLDTTEVLDVATMTFAAGPVMGSARFKCAAVPLDSTHIIVVGGGGVDKGTALSTTEVRPRLTKKI